MARGDKTVHVMATTMAIMADNHAYKHVHALCANRHAIYTYAEMCKKKVGDDARNTVGYRVKPPTFLALSDM